jgi:hypothetical protein
VELPDDKKANMTDSESQTLQTRDGWVQGYNGQAMVDCDNQIIVAEDVTTDAKRCPATGADAGRLTMINTGYYFCQSEMICKRSNSR